MKYFTNGSKLRVLIDFTFGEFLTLVFEEAKDLATYQSPTEWDIVKPLVITTDQNSQSAFYTALPNASLSTYDNMLNIIYTYIPTLPEFDGYNLLEV